MKAWLRASHQTNVKQHQLTWVGSHFACKLCFRKFKSLPSFSVSCSGHPRAGIGAISTAIKNQHKPVIAGFTGLKQGFLIACLRCGGFSFDRIALLAKPCSGHLGPRANTLKRLAKGKHPYCKQSFVTRLWTPLVSKNGKPKLIKVKATGEITGMTSQASTGTLQGQPLTATSSHIGTITGNHPGMSSQTSTGAATGPHPHAQGPPDTGNPAPSTHPLFDPFDEEYAEPADDEYELAGLAEFFGPMCDG
jgi:hypothetical protein